MCKEVITSEYFYIPPFAFVGCTRTELEYYWSLRTGNPMPEGMAGFADFKQPDVMVNWIFLITKTQFREYFRERTQVNPIDWERFYDTLSTLPIERVVHQEVEQIKIAIRTLPSYLASTLKIGNKLSLFGHECLHLLCRHREIETRLFGVPIWSTYKNDHLRMNHKNSGCFNDFELWDDWRKQ